MYLCIKNNYIFSLNLYIYICFLLYFLAYLYFSIQYRFIVTSYQISLIFSSSYKQAILERIPITPSSIEDFSSSRRPVCQCGQCFNFSIQLCWRATARRGVVPCLKMKVKKEKKEQENRKNGYSKTSNVYITR